MLCNAHYRCQLRLHWEAWVPQYSCQAPFQSGPKGLCHFEVSCYSIDCTLAKWVYSYHRHCINTLIPLLKISKCPFEALEWGYNSVCLLLLEANVNRPAVQTCVKQLVLLHEHLHRTDTQCRHIPLRKKILNCLKICIVKGNNSAEITGQLYYTDCFFSRLQSSSLS